MNISSAFILISITSVLFAGDDPKAGEAPDATQIQGAWTVLSWSENGKKKGDDKMDEVRFFFTENTMSFGPKGDPVTVEYQLDPATNPRSIDTTHTLGEGPKFVQLGIYELDDERLKLCLGAAGEARPTHFGADDASTFLLERGSDATPEP